VKLGETVTGACVRTIWTSTPNGNCERQWNRSKVGVWGKAAWSRLKKRNTKQDLCRYSVKRKWDIVPIKRIVQQFHTDIHGAAEKVHWAPDYSGLSTGEAISLEMPLPQSKARREWSLPSLFGCATDCYGYFH